MKNFFLLPIFLLISYLSYGVQTAYAEASISLRVAPLHYDLAINPGEMTEVDAYIENISAETVNLETESSDFFVDDAGGYIFSGEKEISNENLRPYLAKDWLSVEQKDLTLAAGEGKVLKLKISVPQNAILGGHYGAVFFRTKCDLPADPAVVSTDKSSVCVSGRVGVLFLIQVGGEAVKKESLKIIDLPKFSLKGKTSFSVEIENEGNTHFRPDGQIVITNIFDQEISKMKIKDKTILPTMSRKFSEDLTRKDLFGFYKIRGSVKDGDGNEMKFSRHILMPPWKEMLSTIIAAGLFVWFF